MRSGIAGSFQWALCCAVVLNTPASSSAQTSPAQTTPGPVRDPGGWGSVSPLPTGTAAISGTITTTPPGQAAVGVRVSLFGRDVPSRSTFTDTEGRFSFTDLPAGRYSVNAFKQGYVNVSYGQRRPDGGGSEIPLTDGQRVQIALHIPRGGVITGTVLDERGEPAIGVMVRGVRLLRGQRRDMSSSTTDDRGIYRLHSLQPGNYGVCAMPRNMGMQTESQRTQMELDSLRRMLESPSGAAQSDQTRRLWTARLTQLRAQLAQAPPATGYAPVCYPNSGLPDSGTIAIAAGEERNAIDLQLSLTPVARVEGTVVRPPGTELHHLMLQIGNNEGFSEFDRGFANATESGGRFVFQNIPPGQYTIIAMLNPPTPQMPGASESTAQFPRYWAQSVATVAAGQDVTGIVLELQRGATVSGQIVFEGTGQQPPADLRRGQISIFPFSPPTGGFSFETNARGTVEASGRFTIPDVLPGKYRLSATFPGPMPWLLQEVVVSGQDALDFPLEVKANQNVNNVVVTLTDQQADLSGTVVDEKGQPVAEHTLLLYATDSKYWMPQSRRIRVIRAGADGSYSFRGVPPGEYRLTSLIDPDPDVLYLRETLEQLDATSARITLSRGEKRVEHVRVR